VIGIRKEEKSRTLFMLNDLSIAKIRIYPYIIKDNNLSTRLPEIS